MLVDHKSRFVMVAVPKTGSTSLHYALANILDVNFASKGGAPAVYHIYASDIKKIMGVQWNDYYVFSMVRNPYDRLVSLFHDFKFSRGFIKAKSFSEFVKKGLCQNWIHDVHFKPQYEFLTGEGEEEGEVIVPHLMKYEEGVQKAMDDVAFELDVKTIPVGHARKSDRQKYEDYYTDRRVIDIVNEVYKRDFETFGYQIK